MMNQAENKCEVYFAEDVMYISSDMLMQWNSEVVHWYLLIFHEAKEKTKEKLGLIRGGGDIRKKHIDRNDNKTAILLSFITFVGAGEI